MARLYFNVMTEPGLTDADPGPVIYYFVFQTKDGKKLTLSYQEYHCSVNQDGSMDGKWKGLEYSLENHDGTVVIECTEEDNTKTLQDLLDGAELTAVEFDADSIWVSYGEDFFDKMRCKNAEVLVETYPYAKEEDCFDRVFTFRSDKLITNLR